VCVAVCEMDDESVRGDRYPSGAHPTVEPVRAVLFYQLVVMPNSKNMESHWPMNVES
jgi:hypothetical protein